MMHNVNVDVHYFFMKKKHLFSIGISLFALHAAAHAGEAAPELGAGQERVESDVQDSSFEAPWWIDQRLSLVGRSHPVGVQALYTLGADYLAWGDSNSWKYGYFRAALNGGTSAVVNRVGVEFQFFPISILGFSAGYDWGERWFKPHFVDCNTYDCTGRVDRAYLKVQLMAAYRKFIFVGHLRYEELKHLGGGPVFFDELTLLPCQSAQERVVIYNPALLYTLNDKYKVGITSILAQGITSNTLSNLWGPIVQYAFNPRTQMVLGLGQNHSTLVESGFSAFFMATYTIEPSLGIADLLLRK